MHLKEHFFLKILIVGFFLAMFINLLFLDIYLFRMNSNQSLRVASISQQSTPPSLPFFPSDDKAIGDSELSQVYHAIYQATASLTLTQPTPVTIIREIERSDETPAGVAEDREYYIAFGSGSSTAADWTDVPGLSVYVDNTKYGDIKKVVFEASIYTPTGNQKAYVRLYNVTDKHPVWFSEMSNEGSEAKLLISPSITLDTGNKQYQVQMKTQLGYSAVLAQARLHISAN